MDLLIESNIDFLPIEILKDNKTTDWIVIDYARFIKVMQ